MIPVTEFITTIPNTSSIKIRMRMKTGRGASSSQEERTVRGANLELVSHAIKIPSKEILNIIWIYTYTCVYKMQQLFFPNA